MFWRSPRDGAARFVPKVGTFGRANLTDIYMAVRVWAGVAVLAVGPVFAAIGGRPELWLLTLVPVPTIIDGLGRRNTSTRSLMAPLLIDCTGVGVLITVAGLSPVAVAYSMTVMAAAAVLAPRSQLRVLFPYIGAWMTTGLVVSWIYDLPERWNPMAAMAFTIIHVLLAMVALGMLVTLAMQRLHQVERERSRLIGGFAHDMKNVLTGAVGMAELLANHRDVLGRDEIVEYATMVVDEAREAVAMTEDLLTIERAEAGGLDVSTLTVDLVAEATRVIATTGHGAYITVEETESAHQPVCTGDPVGIRQILRNLISNADRYGGEHLRISVGATDATTFVRVADSGTPIPEVDRERIFDAYKRARHLEHHAESVGLGLTISRHLARLMGGDLAYRHTDGWSVFELTLPRAVSNPIQEEFESPGFGRDSDVPP
ncbi:MAG: HAMP domain-containing sensor histidine kinase, partial [Acidimicrobiia bacterium]